MARYRASNKLFPDKFLLKEPGFLEKLATKFFQCCITVVLMEAVFLLRLGTFSNAVFALCLWSELIPTNKYMQSSSVKRQEYHGKKVL